MKYFITGSNGFLGRNLVNRLTADGHSVFGFDNLSRGREQDILELYQNFELMKGSVLDFDSLHYWMAMKGPFDCVIHMAAVNGTSTFYREPKRVIEVGVQGTINVIKAAKAQDIPEFIFFSSSEVYNNALIIPTPETIPCIIPDPLNPRFSYAASKLIGEMMTIHMGQFKRAIIIRPHNVYGPGDSNHVIPELIEKIKDAIANRLIEGVGPDEDEPLPIQIQGSGKETRSFMYVDDFVEAIMLILQKGVHNEIYHVGSATETAIEEVAKLIAAQYRAEIKILPGELRAGSPLRRLPFTHKMQQLGFKETISLEEGLKRMIQ